MNNNNMIYSVKAYVPFKGKCVYQEEVRGFDATEPLRIKWEAEGYDVNVIMECLKYIDEMRSTRPQDLARRSRNAS